ncbi:hypothetical protein [Kordia sp.]|uniref:hypothetical protein n=1 Tax=Kordia sp. TaxID=1965332 RepID=UPI003D6B6ECA
MKKKKLNSLDLNKKSISNLDANKVHGGDETNADCGYWSRFSKFNHLCDLVSQGPGCRSLHHCGPR